MIIAKSGRAAHHNEPLSYPSTATKSGRSDSRLRRRLSVIALAWLAGCSSGDTQRSPQDQSSSSAALRSKDAAPALPANADAAAATSDAGASANEWRAFARKDDVPVCLFTTWRDWETAEFLEQVKPSASLRENHAINFGVFAPGCASPECVRDVTLQCWADVEGSVITLHARYSGFEKVGATCTSGCAAASAQCNTPLLGKGEYVIVYGDEHWNVRVPSVVRPACLKR